MLNYVSMHSLILICCKTLNLYSRLGSLYSVHSSLGNPNQLFKCIQIKSVDQCCVVLHFWRFFKCELSLILPISRSFGFGSGTFFSNSKTFRPVGGANIESEKVLQVLSPMGIPFPSLFSNENNCYLET